MLQCCLCVGYKAVSEPVKFYFLTQPVSLLTALARLIRLLVL